MRWFVRACVCVCLWLIWWWPVRSFVIFSMEQHSLCVSNRPDKLKCMCVRVCLRVNVSLSLNLRLSLYLCVVLCWYTTRESTATVVVSLRTQSLYWTTFLFCIDWQLGNPKVTTICKVITKLNEKKETFSDGDNERKVIGSKKMQWLALNWQFIWCGFELSLSIHR